MPDNNSKLLTLLVYFLLSVITILSGWNSVSLSGFKDSMPKEYVRLERYNCDTKELRNQLKTINSKLDQLIWNKRLDDK